MPPHARKTPPRIVIDSGTPVQGNAAVVHQDVVLIAQSQGAVQGTTVQSGGSTVLNEQPVLSTTVTGLGRGPAGPSGGAGATFERVFAVASTEWDVTHNLGYTPNVETLDVSRAGMRGKVTYNDSVRTIVEWHYPTAGILVLS